MSNDSIARAFQGMIGTPETVLIVGLRSRDESLTPRPASANRSQSRHGVTWTYNALFGNWPTAADADRPDANWVRDMKVTGS